MKSLLNLMKTGFFVLYFFFFGCAGDQPAYITKQGVEIYLEKGIFRENVIFSQFDSMVETVQYEGPWSVESVKKTLEDYPPQVYIAPGYYMLRGDKAIAGFYELGTSRIKMALGQPRCLPQSSFIHEMLHYMHWWIDNSVDYEHKSYLFKGDPSFEIYLVDLSADLNCVPKTF